MEYKILDDASARQVFSEAVEVYRENAKQMLENAYIYSDNENYLKSLNNIISMQNASALFNFDFSEIKHSIGSFLNKKDFDGLFDYVKRNKSSMAKHKKTIDETIEIGLENRQKNGTKYPTIFDNTSTVLFEIPKQKPADKKLEDILTEVNDCLQEKLVIIEENGTSFINYKKKKEKTFSFFNSRHKNLEEIIEKFSSIDFKDSKLFEAFQTADFTKINDLFKNRGIARDEQNKLLRGIFSDEILVAHLNSEMKNYQQGSFSDKFLSSLRDLSPKYIDMANELQYSASRNNKTTENDDENEVDLIILSIHPYNLATMSTYQDWKSCMSADGENWKYVKEDIAHGTIVAYGVNSENPQKRISRIALKPYTNENGDVVYLKSKQYGSQIGSFDDILQDINDNLFGKHKAGIYNFNENLYTDGLPKKAYIYNNAEELLQIINQKYRKVAGKIIVDGDLDLSKLGLSGKLDLSEITVKGKLNCSWNKPKSLIPPKDCLIVDLSYNQLDIKGVKALAKKTTITSLNVSCNNIGVDGAKSLAKNTIITSLDVSHNKIGNDGAKALAKNTTITSLDVSWNNIGASGAKALAENTTITSLDVRENDIRDDGAKALAENTTITSLSVDHNNIGDDGAKALAENTTITSLNVGDNNIGVDGAKALADNTTIISLNVSGNNIGVDGAKALAQNTTITSLNVGDNKIGDDGAKALAQNTTITSLSVGHNNIGDDGAKALADNTTIISLDVRNNNIGADGVKAFREGLEKNNHNLLELKGIDDSQIDEYLKRNRENASNVLKDILSGKEVLAKDVSCRRNAIMFIANEQAKKEYANKPSIQAEFIKEINATLDKIAPPNENENNIKPESKEKNLGKISKFFNRKNHR